MPGVSVTVFGVEVAGSGNPEEGQKPDGPWYMKKDRTYVKERDDVTIFKSIAVDRHKWDAYNNARQSIHPWIDWSEPSAQELGCTPPWLVMTPLMCCMQVPWSKICGKKFEEIPYPEGARGQEALVITDMGIRGWTEKLNPRTGVLEWENVGIAWDNIKDPKIGREGSMHNGTGILINRTIGQRYTCLNPLAKCCGPVNPPPLHAELSTWFNAGLLCLPTCEVVCCQGSAPGLEKYYRLRIVSESQHSVGSGEDKTWVSDLKIVARGLAEEPQALLDMIMERAATSDGTSPP